MAPPTPDEVSDWVSDTIGGMFPEQRPEQEDLRYSLTVDLEDVSTGGEREIGVHRQVTRHVQWAWSRPKRRTDNMYILRWWQIK